MDKPLPDTQVSFTLNGHTVSANPIPGERLSETLRERLGRRDVKIGCNAGDCGACTVLIAGKPVCACLTATHQASGTTVETLAGLVQNDSHAQQLQDSFQNHGAAQCGICTPGMMVSAVALLRDIPSPDTQQIKDALAGVLCRCTGYRKIIDAVATAGTPTRPQTGNGHAGQPIRRLDGAAKVSATDVFGDDYAPAGTWEILVIRSPHARAGFTLGDLQHFIAQHDGLQATLTARDIPGRNAFGVIPAFMDQPVFAESEARFRGEAIAAIIGSAKAIRAFDPDNFPVTWDPRPAVETLRQAMDPDATRLHEDHARNIMCGGFVACGDAKAALDAADVTVEGRFQSGFVEHAYIEPEAGFAEIIDGRVEIHACTQAPVMDRQALEIILDKTADQIRIMPTATGGGFGSKLDISVQPFLALAALKTGQPVRLNYSRSESMQSTTKRHPSEITLKIGASQDGKLKGFDFTGNFNTGAYASWGPTVANRVPVHASGPYQIGDYRAEAKGIYTHNPPAGAFRGFGVPQTAIAQECLFDALAAKLNLDPLEFRLLNALDNGTPTVCGQVFDQGVGIKACLESLRAPWTLARQAAEAFNATSKTLKHGVGLAAGWYGCGNTSLPNPSTIKSGIRADGTLVLHQGAMDIGQGANTVITQIFATAFGTTPQQIVLIGGDTMITPDAGKTSASRQTFVSGNAARLSGEALRAKVLQRVNAAADAVLELQEGQILVRDGDKNHCINLSELTADNNGYVLSAVATYDPPTKPLDDHGQGVPYAQFGYAAHLVTVAVDTILGTVKPLHFTAAHDVGKAINPLLIEGQVEGGIAQGLGMALMEEYIPGRTENLHDYLIPTIGDIPPIDTIIIEEPDAHGPYGAKGLGEHVLIPTTPAILNAITHACGVRLSQIPATPSRVAAAIRNHRHDH